jgi:transcriptional regulator with XRE-family HTH domain
MKNPKIAEMLKEYRKINHLSVDEVAQYLRTKHVDIATKTIYGWESGQTQPNADNLMHLCRLYGIEDILATFGYQSVRHPLSPISQKEQELILAYRQHKELQGAVDKLLDIKTTIPPTD